MDLLGVLVFSGMTTRKALPVFTISSATAGLFFQHSNNRRSRQQTSNMVFLAIIGAVAIICSGVLIYILATEEPFDQKNDYYDEY